MKEILSHLNLSEEARADFEAKEDFGQEDLKSALEMHGKGLFSQHREALSNDADFVKAFYDNGHQQAAKEFRARIIDKIQGAGYSGKLEDDSGPIPAVKLVEYFANEQAEKIKGKGRGSQELEEKLTEANKAYSELRKAVDEGTLPAIMEAKRELDELKGQAAAAMARNWFTSLLKKDYTIGKDEAAVLMTDRAGRRGWKYGPYGEDGAMSFVDGNGNKIRNADGTKVLSVEEIITELEDGLIAKSNGGAVGSGGNTGGNTGGSGNTVPSAYERRRAAANQMIDNARSANPRNH
jgi:hypothetical protein